MSIERRIELDLSTAGLDARASGQQSPGGHTASREADPQARQAFERAMAGGGASDAQEAEPAARVPDAPASLFGRITAQPLGGASSTPERWVEPLGRELQHMVSQFAVGEGRSGGPGFQDRQPAPPRERGDDGRRGGPSFQERPPIAPRGQDSPPSAPRERGDQPRRGGPAIGETPGQQIR